MCANGFGAAAVRPDNSHVATSLAQAYLPPPCNSTGFVPPNEQSRAAVAIRQLASYRNCSACNPSSLTRNRLGCLFAAWLAPSGSTLAKRRSYGLNTNDVVSATWSTDFRQALAAQQRLHGDLDLSHPLFANTGSNFGSGCLTRRRRRSRMGGGIPG